MDMPERAPARHRLRAGESIRSVALEHGTTPLKLMELNPYVDPTALVAGQELNLPPARASLWPFLAHLIWGKRHPPRPP
jgi:LysM repeat protein